MVPYLYIYRNKERGDAMWIEWGRVRKKEGGWGRKGKSGDSMLGRVYG